MKVMGIWYGNDRFHIQEVGYLFPRLTQRKAGGCSGRPRMSALLTFTSPKTGSTIVFQSNQMDKLYVVQQFTRLEQ